MLHRPKSLRTFFGTLFLALMLTTPLTAAPAAEDRSELAVVTELRLLWGRILEWVGGGQSAGPQDGAGESEATRGAEGENNADGNPTVDPLGSENNADGGPSFDPLG